MAVIEGASTNLSESSFHAGNTEYRALSSKEIKRRLSPEQLLAAKQSVKFDAPLNVFVESKSDSADTIYLGGGGMLVAKISRRGQTTLLPDQD